MKLRTHGQNISEPEVSHIGIHGCWICTEDTEYFLPYDEYPWFKEAKVQEILNVELLHGSHLHWPDLDVDLDVDSLENPEKYPLIYK